MVQKGMDRRTFLGSIAAACAASAGSERVRGQTSGGANPAQGWELLPYSQERRRVNSGGAGLPQGLTGVKEVWEFDAERASTPIVSGGTAYTGTSDGVIAIDTLSGEEGWKHKTEGEVRATPGLNKGTVYAGTSEGEFVAIDARNGDERWSVSLDGSVTTSPMVAGVNVFVGTEKKNRLYSLDIADGSEKWSVETRVPVETGPAITEERVIYVDGALSFALNRFTGKVEWRSYSGGVLSEVTVGETRVYTVGGGTVYAQRLLNGVDRWSKSVRGKVVGGPVLRNNRLYVTTDSGFLYSLDLKSNGWTKWKKEFPGGFVGSPVLVEDTLYGVTLDGNEGHLYAVDPSNGETSGKYVLGSEQVEQDGDGNIDGVNVDLTGGPTVAGANAYIVGEDGLRAFGNENEVPPTAAFDISPTPPPVGEVVTFDASASSAGSASVESYEWRFSSGTEEFFAGGKTYEEAFEEGGLWTVSVTVTDKEGLSDTATKEIQIGGGSGGNTSGEGRVESGGNATMPDVSEERGFFERISDSALLTLGALGAIVSALGFSAYWRMEPEREKLRRRNKKGGLCPDCGASVKKGDEDCGVCGTGLRNQE